MKVLSKFNVVSLAVNLPGPVLASRLSHLGARVFKVEPPKGDPLQMFCPAYYNSLVGKQKVVRLDLKGPKDRAKLDKLLRSAHLLMTSSRSESLSRIDLDWPSLHKKFRHLHHLALVGYPSPDQNRPGHDLTYMAENNLLTPPQMPLTCLADLAGAQEGLIAAILLLFQKKGPGQYREVSLAQAARFFSEPLRFGITGEGKILGGGSPSYNLYQTKKGWLAVAVLEPQFWNKFQNELHLRNPSFEEVQEVLMTRTAEDWESWGQEKDLPLAAVVDRLNKS